MCVFLFIFSFSLLAILDNQRNKNNCRYMYLIKFLSFIQPRLLQRSKEWRGHYSTLYHATSQWIMRSDTHLFFWQNVKKFVHLKFTIMSVICGFHVSDVVLTFYILYYSTRTQLWYINQYQYQNNLYSN